jgi:hypothetical protein
MPDDLKDLIAKDLILKYSNVPLKYSQLKDKRRTSVLIFY